MGNWGLGLSVEPQNEELRFGEERVRGPLSDEGGGAQGVVGEA